MNWNFLGYAYHCDTTTGVWSTTVEGERLTADSLATLQDMIRGVISIHPAIHQGFHIHRFNRDYSGLVAGTWVATFPDSESWLDYVLKSNNLVSLLSQIELYRAANPIAANPWQLPRAERLAHMQRLAIAS